MFISTVEKWPQHLEDLLHMSSVQVLQVNLCPSLNKLLKAMKRLKQKVFSQAVDI